MGYYTAHTLEVIEGDYALIEALRDECDCANYALEESGDFSDTTKWYDHEKDMRAFSKKHPTALFKLSGEGEESGDIWSEHYRDGLMQREKAEIVVGEFDESKMT